jgi:Trypsin-co-occurring domain 2
VGTGDGGAVGLADFLQGLRAELRASMLNAKNEPGLTFQLTKLDVELQVAAETSADGQGKVKFWVVEVGAGVKGGEKTVQTIKLSLQPMADGKPSNLNISTGPTKRPEE